MMEESGKEKQKQNAIGWDKFLKHVLENSLAPPVPKIEDQNNNSTTNGNTSSDNKDAATGDNNSGSNNAEKDSLTPQEVSESRTNEEWLIKNIKVGAALKCVYRAARETHFRLGSITQEESMELRSLMTNTGEKGIFDHKLNAFREKFNLNLTQLVPWLERHEHWVRQMINHKDGSLAPFKHWMNVEGMNERMLMGMKDEVCKTIDRIKRELFLDLHSRFEAMPEIKPHIILPDIFLQEKKKRKAIASFSFACLHKNCPESYFDGFEECDQHMRICPYAKDTEHLAEAFKNTDLFDSYVTTDDYRSRINEMVAAYPNKDGVGNMIWVDPKLVGKVKDYKKINFFDKKCQKKTKAQRFLDQKRIFLTKNENFMYASKRLQKCSL